MPEEQYNLIISYFAPFITELKLLGNFASIAMIYLIIFFFCSNLFKFFNLIKLKELVNKFVYSLFFVWNFQCCKTLILFIRGLILTLDLKFWYLIELYVKLLKMISYVIHNLSFLSWELVQQFLKLDLIIIIHLCYILVLCNLIAAAAYIVYLLVKLNIKFFLEIIQKK